MIPRIEKISNHIINNLLESQHSIIEMKYIKINSDVQTETYQKLLQIVEF